jgi:hypothetical protein
MKPGILKQLWPLLSMAMWIGCASMGPPLPPSLELPKRPNDLRALRKGDKVYLAWTAPTVTTDGQTIRHPGATSICRSRELKMAECGSPIGIVPPVLAAEKQPVAATKATGFYMDQLPTPADARPDDEVTYAVEVLNDGKRGAGLSNQVRAPLFPALPPPQGFQAAITADGVSITWDCREAPPRQFPDLKYKLRISRRIEGSATETKVADPDLLGCSGLPVLDRNFEWEKTYEYHASAVIVVPQPGKPSLKIDSADTPSVKVFAHDVFPPAVPSGLQAVFSGPGQKLFVDLVWSPDSEADLGGYNVYRREGGGQAMKLNSDLVKAPAFRDEAVQPGKGYIYSVSAVDVRGNESAKSEEASESVPPAE